MFIPAHVIYFHQLHERFEPGGRFYAVPSMSMDEFFLSGQALRKNWFDLFIHVLIRKPSQGHSDGKQGLNAVLA
ncbi:hypothetical protein [Photobacterium sp. GSS17]|uniref:hypothetical protein n=1 Tax=Photobacterium sp. GSS17 TaxID=3020715 RepID=UPI0023602F8B|nr:hypothetical protein [Photobacterium sp. GSS17]